MSGLGTPRPLDTPPKVDRAAIFLFLPNASYTLPGRISAAEHGRSRTQRAPPARTTRNLRKEKYPTRGCSLPAPGQEARQHSGEAWFP